MKSSLNRLSNELLMIILTYVNEEDRQEWGKCCKKWYEEIFRTYVRELTIHVKKWSSEEGLAELSEKIPQMIKNPALQLIISYPYTKLEFTPEATARVLAMVNYSIKTFSGNYEDLSDVIRIIGPEHPVKVRKYYGCIFETPVGQYDFYTVIPVPYFVVIHFYNLKYFFPFIPSITTLTIESNCIHRPLDQRYFTHLHTLIMRGCWIDDEDLVLMDRIPELLLEKCPNITDISVLHHNEKISVLDCMEVLDYTNCFTCSKSITLKFYKTQVVVDMSQWKQVQTLSFDSHLADVVYKHPQLPVSTKCCRLNGTDIFQNLDLHITPDHQLRELHISNTTTVTEVEGFGFDQLRVVGFHHLENFCSLKGLGVNKNQKVIVRYCPLITSFAELRNVADVEIDTPHIVTLEELSGAKEIMLSAKDIIHQPMEKFEKLQSFYIAWSRGLTLFDGFERIPFLVMSIDHYSILSDYFQRGGKLYSQTLDLLPGYSIKHRSFIVDAKYLLDDWLWEEYVMRIRSDNVRFLRRDCYV